MAIRKIKRKLFLTFLVLFSGSTGWGWVSHQGKVGDYYTQMYQSSNPRVELRDTRALQQSTSEECYLFAFVGALEVANQNGWNRKYAPPISAEFLFMEKLKAWAQETLAYNLPYDGGFYFLRGGDVHHAMKLSVEEGLLPQAAFRPVEEFDYWNFDEIYNDVRNQVKASRAAVNSAQSAEQRLQITAQVVSKIESRLTQHSGVWPKQFRWKNRTWTAHNFERQVGLKRSTQIFMLYPQGKWEMGDPWDLRRSLYDLVKFFNGAFRYRQSTWNQIVRYFVRSIDSGLPTIVSLKWGETYHVMNVVGYEYDNQNRIVSFKVKNSWGDEFGDKGYAYYTPEDLRKNISTVWGFQRPE